MCVTSGVHAATDFRLCGSFNGCIPEDHVQQLRNDATRLVTWYGIFYGQAAAAPRTAPLGKKPAPEILFFQSENLKKYKARFANVFYGPKHDIYEGLGINLKCTYIFFSWDENWN